MYEMTINIYWVYCVPDTVLHAFPIVFFNAQYSPVR